MGINKEEVIEVFSEERFDEYRGLIGFEIYKRTKEEMQGEEMDKTMEEEKKMDNIRNDVLIIDYADKDDTFQNSTGFNSETKKEYIKHDYFQLHDNGFDKYKIIERRRNLGRKERKGERRIEWLIEDVRNDVLINDHIDKDDIFQNSTGFNSEPNKEYIKYDYSQSHDDIFDQETTERGFGNEKGNKIDLRKRWFEKAMGKG